jgi:squalene cyclase
MARKQRRDLRGGVIWLCSVTAPALAQAPEAKSYPQGVTPEIDASITRGLEYLVRTQARDGSWRGGGQEGVYPAAMTALAGMALIASGSTPTRGPHWKAVRRATDFLMKAAQPDGLISVPSEEQRPMYGHGFAMMYLASVYGMEEDSQRQQQIHRVLTSAVKLTAQSQSPAGGWLYTPDAGGDEGSVTVTQIQALRACRQAGITVSVATIDRAVKYIHDSANPDGSIRYRVSGPAGGRPPITAAAVAVLYNAGKYEDPIAEKALVSAVRTLPLGSVTQHYYYAHLYLAQALYQRGGRQFDEYFEKQTRWLLKQQRKDGSWEGESVGAIYGTTIALTIMQLPYAIVPIYQR